jgi:hypothetical protein
MSIVRRLDESQSWSQQDGKEKPVPEHVPDDT